MYNTTDSKTTWRRNVISMMIALLPLTALLRTPGTTMGLGMVGILSLVPWLFVINEGRFHLSTIKKFFWLIIFCAYSMYQSINNINSFFSFLLILIWVLGTNRKWVDIEYILEKVKIVATIASLIVVLQVICYYLLGFRFIAVIPDVLKAALQIQYSHLFLGVMKAGLYRPSAFFLEPSHFSQYSMPALLFCLLSEKKQINFACIISLGIVLSTSGMGIAMVLGSWGMYIFSGFYSFNKKNINKIVFTLFFGIIMLVILSQQSFFQNAVNRIILSNENLYTGHNAIWGRLFWWDYYFSPLTLMEMLTGVGYDADTGNYMTGFMRLLYCSGIVGVTFFCLSLLQNIKRRNIFGVALTGCYFVLNIFSGLANVISMIYFFVLIFGSERSFELSEVKKK